MKMTPERLFLSFIRPLGAVIRSPSSAFKRRPFAGERIRGEQLRPCCASRRLSLLTRDTRTKVLLLQLLRLLLTFTSIIRCSSVGLQRSRRRFYINSLQIHIFPQAERGILIFDCIYSIVFQTFLKENGNVSERADPSRLFARL